MPVADTSFIIDLMRRDREAIAFYELCEQREQAVSTTVVSALELNKGAYLSAGKENLLKVKAVLGLFTILPIDERIYEIFGKSAAELQSRGIPMGDFDELIAAITLGHDSIIITRDRHFEQVPGLTVISY
jgi:tRNA(fMet)-specific endonuclease VapC